MAVVCYSVHFFALPPLKSALGTPTNAVYGFLTMLIKLYEEINPDYIAVAFDKGRQTFRTEMYSEYKGNRPDGKYSFCLEGEVEFGGELKYIDITADVFY